MKKWIRAGCPAVLTLFLFTIFYAHFDIAPFGEKTIAWCDMEQQVIPVLLELRAVLHGDGSLFYSMGNAGGMNFWGVFFFFAASPFSLLVGCVETADMLTFVNWLVALKTATAAMTAGLYFRSRYPALRGSWQLLLSLMYAFCGYGMLYYQNVVWLDLLYLFPLLLLTLEALLRRRKILGYVLVLSACVVVQYYLCYMLAIFLLLASGLYLRAVSEPAERRAAAARFVFGSGVSLLLTAVVWLPSLLQVMSSGRIGSVLDNVRNTSVVNNFGDKLALLLCTAMCLAVVPFLFRKVPRTECFYRLRWLYFLLLIPIFIEPVNLLWHTGSYQAFAFRFGYMPVLIGLSLAAELLSRTHAQPVKHSGRKAMLVLGGAVLVYAATAVFLLITQQERMRAYSSSLWQTMESVLLLLLLATLAAGCYLLGLTLYRRNRLTGRTLTICMLLVCAGELYTNFSVYIAGAASVDTVYEQTIAAGNAVSTDGLTRVKLEQKYCHVNMLGAIGYRTFAHYTSLTGGDLQAAIKKLGYSSYWMELSGLGGTVITDALLGNRYSIGTLSDFEPYQTVLQSDTLSVAESEIGIAPAIISTLAPETMQTLPFTNRAALQQTLATAFLGVDDLVTVYPPTKEKHTSYSEVDGRYHVEILENTADTTLSFSFFVSGEQALYFDLFSNYAGTALQEAEYGAVDVVVNGRTVVLEYPKQRNNGILSLGTYENKNVTVRVRINQEIDAASFGVFSVDLVGLREAIAAVNQPTLTDTDGILTAQCSAETDSYVYLSLPYDTGLQATVNDTNAEIFKVNDAFCAVAIPAGESRVVLTYLPPGMRPAAAISTIGLLVLVGYGLLRKRFVGHGVFLQRVCIAILFAACGAIILVVYLASTLLSCF